NELELGWLLDRKIGRPGPLENAIDVSRRLPELIGEIHAIRSETALFREKRNSVDRCNTMAGRLVDDEVAMNVGKCVQQDDQTTVRLACQIGKPAFNVSFIVDLHGKRFDPKARGGCCYGLKI